MALAHTSVGGWFGRSDLALELESLRSWLFALFGVGRLVATRRLGRRCARDACLGVGVSCGLLRSNVYWFYSNDVARSALWRGARASARAAP